MHSQRTEGRKKLRARKEETVFRVIVKSALDHSYQSHDRGWKRMSCCSQSLSCRNNIFVSLPWKRNAVVRIARNPPLTEEYINEQLRDGVEKFFLRINVVSISFLKHILLPEIAHIMNSLLTQWFLNHVSSLSKVNEYMKISHYSLLVLSTNKNNYNMQSTSVHLFLKLEKNVLLQPQLI